MWMNLKKYIREYVPKYICSFHNTKVTSRNLKHKKLRIGVDDYGEITGIPYIGNLFENHENIVEEVENIIDLNINKVCECMSYEVKLQKCKIDKDLLDDSGLDISLNDYDKMKRKYEIDMINYIHKKRKWDKDIIKYKGKLRNLFLDVELRGEFLMYLHENGLHEYCTFINNSCKINYTTADIKKYKYNNNHLIYWCIEFKENKVYELMNNKPIKPLSMKLFNTEYCQMTQLSNVRKRLIKNNENMNYSVLDIIVKKNDMECSCDEMLYYDEVNSTWKNMSRVMIDGIPRCSDNTKTQF